MDSLFHETSKYVGELGPVNFVSDDGVAQLQILAQLVIDRGHELYIFVVEYDVGVGQALDNPDLCMNLT